MKTTDRGKAKQTSSSDKISNAVKSAFKLFNNSTICRLNPGRKQLK